jgi:hypothetical protein
MQAFGRNQISGQVSGFRIWGLLTPDMKLNGVIPIRKANFIDPSRPAALRKLERYPIFLRFRTLPVGRFNF